MKKIIFTAAILLSVSALHAQRDTTFYRHEVRASLVPINFSSLIWFPDRGMYYTNISFAYMYRPMKWFWVGGSFINYFGNKTNYDWREYYPDGSYHDFEKSKRKFCTAIDAEIRFSYLNKKSVILYSGLTFGVGYEDGLDSQWATFPRIFFHGQYTLFGISCNFGEKKKGFIGGEFGVGLKGFLSIHGGYRF